MAFVINFAKSVSESSMHWSDIYVPLSISYKNVTYPSLILDGNFRLGKQKFLRSVNFCSEIRSKYISKNIFTSSFFLCYLCIILKYRKSSSLKIHSHSPLCFIPVLPVKIFFPQTIIIVTQHNTFNRFTFINKILSFLNFVLSDEYVFCSQAVKSDFSCLIKKNTILRLLFSKKLTSASVIPNGFNDTAIKSFLTSTNRSIENLPYKNDRSCVILSRFTKQKNPFYILKLIKKLNFIHHYYWFGSGPLKEKVLEKAYSLGLQRKISFMGNVDRHIVYDYLSNSSFYLSASLWEGLSLADLEALALCCFPLLSDIPQRQIFAQVLGIKLCSLDSFDSWNNLVNNYISISEEDKHSTLSKTSYLCFQNFSGSNMINTYKNLYHN